MPAAVSFSNVVANRHCCAPHLLAQLVFFFGWQLLLQSIGPFAEFARQFVQFEVVKPESSFFHCRNSSLPPPQTHHSPTHPLTTHPLIHSPLTHSLMIS